MAEWAQAVEAARDTSPGDPPGGSLDETLEASIATPTTRSTVKRSVSRCLSVNVSFCCMLAPVRVPIAVLVPVPTFEAALTAERLHTRILLQLALTLVLPAVKLIPRSKVPVVPTLGFAIGGVAVGEKGQEEGRGGVEMGGGEGGSSNGDVLHSPAHSRASTYTLEDLPDMASLLEDARCAAEQLPVAQ